MHLEVLVEGLSDKLALKEILTKILGEQGDSHTWSIHKHQGIGELPENPNARPDPKNTTLLHNLPASLRAYGRALGKNGLVVVLLDLDRSDQEEALQVLHGLLKYCHPAPNTLFHFAVEEMEAWYFGDMQAILRAYPKANRVLLASYQQDSICDTWERLADAIYPGGLNSLYHRGKFSSLKEKCRWSEEIPPYMNVNKNCSPSFCAFRDELRGWVKGRS